MTIHGDAIGETKLMQNFCTSCYIRINLPDVDSVVGITTNWVSLSTEHVDVVDKYSGWNSTVFEVVRTSVSIAENCVGHAI